MSELREVLTGAYSEQWSSRDVREGNCSLDLCHSSLRRKPNGELVRRGQFESTAHTEVVWIEPQTVLREIFKEDSYGSYLGFIHRCPITGKVDAPEATRLWKEWQIRTGLHGRAYAYQFLREVGLPIRGGLLASGELDPKLAEASGITREAWEYELKCNRRLCVRYEWKGDESGVFVTCDECRWKRGPDFTGVHCHSPWESSANGAEAKMAELSANSFYRNPARRADWDCLHAAQLIALVKTF